MTISKPPTWWLPMILAAALSLLGATYLGHIHADQDVAQDVAALKVRQDDTTRRLDRIENKVDKVVEGLFGKP